MTTGLFGFLIIAVYILKHKKEKKIMKKNYHWKTHRQKKKTHKTNTNTHKANIKTNIKTHIKLTPGILK
jgi:hypothetical protein